jgi:hypothetical protein
MRKMPPKLVQRRERILGTPDEAAATLGLSLDQLETVERTPVPQPTLDYLNAIGWQITFYPRRKPRKAKGL